MVWTKKVFAIISSAYINTLILQLYLGYMQYYSSKSIMEWLILCVLSTFTRKQKKILSEEFMSPHCSLICLMRCAFINSWLYFHHYTVCSLKQIQLPSLKHLQIKQVNFYQHRLHPKKFNYIKKKKPQKTHNPNAWRSTNFCLNH